MSKESAFEETQTREVAHGARGSRVVVKISSDGTIEPLPQNKQDLLAAAVANSPEVLGDVIAASPSLSQQLTGGTGIIPDDLIQPEHVARLLTLFSIAEKFILPGIIAKKLEGKYPQLKPIEFPPELVDRAFTISDEQKAKVAPAGAQAANKHLPEKIRKYIVQVGPLGEFIGGMGDIVKTQCSVLITSYVAQLSAKPKNGEAKIQPEAGEMTGSPV